MTTFNRCLNPTCPCHEPVPAATCPQGRDWCRPNTPCMTCRLAQAVLTPKEKR